MESALADLAQALRERLAVIRDEESRRDETKHIDRLRAISEKIDDCKRRFRSQSIRGWQHYLQRRSYDKALEFLEASSY